MEYPESRMNVAVHFGNGTVRIYGWAIKGFRKLLGTREFANQSKALEFIAEHNNAQRRALGLSHK